MFVFLKPLLLRDAVRRVSTVRASRLPAGPPVRGLAGALLFLIVLLAAPHAFAQEPADEDEDAAVDAADRIGDDEDEDDEDGRPEDADGAARPAERGPVIQFEVALRAPLESAASASPAFLNGTAFVPLRGGRLAAVDLSTGRVRWTADAATEITPAAGDGLVFVAGRERLDAIDAAGATRWSLPVAGGFSAPPLWDTGWLIAGTAQNEVLCLRARDGAVLWTRRFPSSVAAQPAIAADRAYVTFSDGLILALDLRTGQTVWEQRLEGAGAEPLALDERVFVGAAGRRFYSLSTESGNVRWVWRSMGGSVRAAPVVDTERVFFTAMDNLLRALDRFNGSQKWMAGLPFRPYGAPILVGDVLFVTGVGPETRAYRVTDGRLVGEHTGTADLAAPPRAIPHVVPEFTMIALLTRSPAELILLRRRFDVPVVPLTEPFGVPVPLVPPPGYTG